MAAVRARRWSKLLDHHIRPLSNLGAATVSLPLYAKCPRCRGSRYVDAVVECSGGWFPTRHESFACPMCHETGEADMDLIIEMALEENQLYDDGLLQ